MHLNTFFQGKWLNHFSYWFLKNSVENARMTAVKERAWNQSRNTLFFKRKFQLIQPGNVALSRECNCDLAHPGLDISPVSLPWSCSSALLLETRTLSDRECEYSETSRKKIWQTTNYLIYFPFLLQTFALKKKKKRSKWKECVYFNGKGILWT